MSSTNLRANAHVASDARDVRNHRLATEDAPCA